MNLGEKLRHIRKQKGLTQEELALKIQITRQAISMWERNEVKPDIDNLKRISRLFEISIDFLLDNENEKIEFFYDKSPVEGKNSSNKKWLFALLVGINIAIVIGYRLSILMSIMILVTTLLIIGIVTIVVNIIGNR